MPYVIYKATRLPASISYYGPTWDKAELRHLYKEQYRDREVAERLAHVLSLHNPVGFRVAEVSEKI